MNTNKENKYLKAKERVEEVKQFYTKVLSSLGVIVVVGAINYYLDKWEHPWFLWVVFGLSISLIFKAIKVFGFNSFFGKDWEERKIKEFMQDDERPSKWE